MRKLTVALFAMRQAARCLHPAALPVPVASLCSCFGLRDEEINPILNPS